MSQQGLDVEPPAGEYGERDLSMMEELDRRGEQESLSPEEVTLLALLARLIKDYDDRIELPKLDPCSVVLFLMKQKGLRQADLLPVFGSRSIASDVLSDGIPG